MALPPRTLPFCVGCVTLLSYLWDPLLFFLFSEYFVTPPSVRLSPSFMCLDPPTGQRTARFFSLSALVPMYPFVAFLPSVWFSCDVLMLAHQLDIYHRNHRTSEHQPCPRDSACTLSACLLRVSFLYVSVFLIVFLISVPSPCFSFFHSLFLFSSVLSI